MFYDPASIAGVGHDNGRFNARAAMIPGGAVDGLSNLAAALVRAPALRRQIEQKQQQTDFENTLQSRGADRADRAQQLMNEFHRAGITTQKGNLDRETARDKATAAEAKAKLDEEAKHHRMMEDVLRTRAEAGPRGATPKGPPSTHQSQIDPYMEVTVTDAYGHPHKEKRLKTDAEIQAESGARNQLFDAIDPNGVQAKGGRVLALIDELKGHTPYQPMPGYGPAAGAAPAAPAPSADIPDVPAGVPEPAGEPAAAAPASNPLSLLQEAENDPAWKAHLDKRFPNRASDPDEAQAAAEYVAPFEDTE